jgi:hypothetical protein
MYAQHAQYARRGPGLFRSLYNANRHGARCSSIFELSSRLPRHVLRIDDSDSYVWKTKVGMLVHHDRVKVYIGMLCSSSHPAKPFQAVGWTLRLRLEFREAGMSSKSESESDESPTLTGAEADPSSLCDVVAVAVVLSVAIEADFGAWCGT